MVKAGEKTINFQIKSNQILFLILLSSRLLIANDNIGHILQSASNRVYSQTTFGAAFESEQIRWQQMRAVLYLLRILVLARVLIRGEALVKSLYDSSWQPHLYFTPETIGLRDRCGIILNRPYAHLRTVNFYFGWRLLNFTMNPFNFTASDIVEANAIIKQQIVTVWSNQFDGMLFTVLLNGTMELVAQFYDVIADTNYNLTFIGQELRVAAYLNRQTMVVMDMVPPELRAWIGNPRLQTWTPFETPPTLLDMRNQLKCDFMNRCLWGIRTGSLLTYPMGPKPMIYALKGKNITTFEFARNGTVDLMYTATQDGFIYQWRFDTGINEYRPRRVNNAHAGAHILVSHVLKNQTLIFRDMAYRSSWYHLPADTLTDFHTAWLYENRHYNITSTCYQRDWPVVFFTQAIRTSLDPNYGKMRPKEYTPITNESVFIEHPNLTRTYDKIICEMTEEAVEHSPSQFATLKQFECYFDENLVLNNPELYEDTHIENCLKYNPTHHSICYECAPGATLQATSERTGVPIYSSVFRCVFDGSSGNSTDWNTTINSTDPSNTSNQTDQNGTTNQTETSNQTEANNSSSNSNNSANSGGNSSSGTADPEEGEQYDPLLLLLLLAGNNSNSTNNSINGSSSEVIGGNSTNGALEQDPWFNQSMDGNITIPGPGKSNVVVVLLYPDPEPVPVVFRSIEFMAGTFYMNETSESTLTDELDVPQPAKDVMNLINSSILIMAEPFGHTKNAIQLTLLAFIIHSLLSVWVLASLYYFVPNIPGVLSSVLMVMWRAYNMSSLQLFNLEEPDLPKLNHQDSQLVYGEIVIQNDFLQFAFDPFLMICAAICNYFLASLLKRGMKKLFQYKGTKIKLTWLKVELEDNLADIVIELLPILFLPCTIFIFNPNFQTYSQKFNLLLFSGMGGVGVLFPFVYFAKLAKETLPVKYLIQDEVFTNVNSRRKKVLRGRNISLGQFVRGRCEEIDVFLNTVLHLTVPIFVTLQSPLPFFVTNGFIMLLCFFNSFFSRQGRLSNILHKLYLLLFHGCFVLMRVYREGQIFNILGIAAACVVGLSLLHRFIELIYKIIKYTSNFVKECRKRSAIVRRIEAVEAGFQRECIMSKQMNFQKFIEEKEKEKLAQTHKQILRKLLVKFKQLQLKEGVDSSVESFLRLSNSSVETDFFEEDSIEPHIEPLQIALTAKDVKLWDRKPSKPKKTKQLANVESDGPDLKLNKTNRTEISYLPFEQLEDLSNTNEKGEEFDDPLERRAAISKTVAAKQKRKRG